VSGALGAQPQGHHHDHAEEHAHQHRQKHHEHERGLPAHAEEQMQGDVVLVVQREGEQRKKNGCIEQPHQVFQGFPFVVGEL